MIIEELQGYKWIRLNELNRTKPQVLSLMQ